MYSFPSASQTCEPDPRSITTGVMPTERKARTGELTPPGMACCARRKMSSDLLCGLTLAPFPCYGRAPAKRMREAVERILRCRGGNAIDQPLPQVEVSLRAGEQV